MLINLLYYFFAFLVGLAAVFILFTSQPVLATIYLICIIIGLSAIYFLQEASLVAIMQIILHAGGALVLLICSLLFSNPQAVGVKKHSRSYYPILALGMLFLSICIIGWKLYTPISSWISPSLHPIINSVTVISCQIVGAYGLLLEIVGILLLIALVGVVHIFTPNNR